MKVHVGKILKAQGIKGEVKMASLIDNAENFKNFKYLYLNDQRIGVKSVRISNGFVFVQFSTVTDRNTAESMRGWNVFADKEQISLDEGRFFIDDLIGSTIVLDDGTEIGVLEEILQNSMTADVYVAKNGDRQIMFPLLKDVLKQVDIENGRIVLFKTRFYEVCVDEI